MLQAQHPRQQALHTRELTRGGRVGDGVLAADDAAVRQLRAQHDALLGADGRQHNAALRYARHAAEHEDGRLQRPQKDAGSREKKVAWQQAERQQLGLANAAHK